MVNWKDPEVIAYDFFLYEQIAVFLLGFYGCVHVYPFVLAVLSACITTQEALS